MATIRILRPLTQQAVRLNTRPTVRTSHVAKRMLNTETAPIMYSAHAKVVGARTGHVDGDDLKVDLTMAKALGGSGDKGKTNPEELFAAGYGACFQASMNTVAASMGLKMPTKKEDSVVETTVHLVGNPKEHDMGLRVEMKVKVKGLKKDDLDKVVEKAKEMCPYSRATQGNVHTTIEVEQQ